jgi:hypothetical protein
VVFASHSRWRSKITPAERHRAMRWAQRLKRVFKLDLQSCEGCGGQVRVIACLEDPLVMTASNGSLVPDRVEDEDSRRRG